MFQQPAITENLTAGRSHPPAADASASDTSPAERDPFLDHYFSRISPLVPPSFPPLQLDAINAFFCPRLLAPPPFVILRSLPLPPVLSPLFLLLLLQPLPLSPLSLSS